MATKADRLSVSDQQTKLTASAVERIVSALVIALVGLSIVYGYLHRHALGFSPDQGFGYALGIIGGVLMLILLAYPLRKRSRTRRAVGSVGFWFRFHMFLGLVGPLAILFHSRFTWGSLNAAVALAAMIVVASSGLIGRFLYSRVHRGYSGRKLELRSLKEEMEGLLGQLEARGYSHRDATELLQPFEIKAVRAGAAFWSSAAALISLGISTRLSERQMLKDLPMGRDRRINALRESLQDYFEAVRRAAEFAFYDRLLRLWHLLHLPLFILLVASAILHVVAVHMY